MFLLPYQQATVALSLLVFVRIGSAFSPTSPRQQQHAPTALFMTDEPQKPLPSTSATDATTKGECWYSKWAHEADILSTKSLISIRDPTSDERGKGGVSSSSDIQALAVLCRIPRSLIVTAVDAPKRAMQAASEANQFSWATDLTAATLVALHPTKEETDDAVGKKQAWVASWEAGGWATDSADLGPKDAKFGASGVTGSLLATGSDNDHNIYAKFRMPCHPVLLRASNGLSVLTGCTTDEAREAMTCRGRAYRSMRDALQELVLVPTDRPNGSNRERRIWDVADTLSRVLSRATMLQLDDDDDGKTHAVIPVHERLAQCDSSGENCKLVANGEEILLVATRDMTKGEAITRDYAAAPRLDQDVSEGSLRLLLQFGLPPNAW